MKPQRLTPVQRKVLRWFRDAEGQVVMQTGHRRTTMIEGTHDKEIILCQTLVQYFLRARGYIEPADGIGRWRLTREGRARTARLK